MSDAVVVALITGGFGLLVALVGIIGSAVARRAQQRTETNERRLNALEAGSQHLIDNLRRDADDARVRAEAAEKDAAAWRTRAIAAERRVDEYLQNREKP